MPFGVVPADEPDILNSAPRLSAVIPTNTLLVLISVANDPAVNVAVAPFWKKFVKPSLASVFGLACAINLTTFPELSVTLYVVFSIILVTASSVNEPDEKVNPDSTADVATDVAGAYAPAKILTTVNVSAYFKYSFAA